MPRIIRVLVCGGREYSDRNAMFRYLDAHHQMTPFECIIHGAQRGADSFADEWARFRDVPVMRFEVTKEEWKRIGPKAGPLRNQRMLDEGKPTIVIAFEGDRGTRDMMKRARAANIPVRTPFWVP